MEENCAQRPTTSATTGSTPSATPRLPSPARARPCSAQHRQPRSRLSPLPRLPARSTVASRSLPPRRPAVRPPRPHGPARPRRTWPSPPRGRSRHRLLSGSFPRVLQKSSTGSSSRRRRAGSRTWCSPRSRARRSSSAVRSRGVVRSSRRALSKQVLLRRRQYHEGKRRHSRQARPRRQPVPPSHAPVAGPTSPAPPHPPLRPCPPSSPLHLHRPTSPRARPPTPSSTRTRRPSGCPTRARRGASGARNRSRCGVGDITVEFVEASCAGSARPRCVSPFAHRSGRQPD